MSVEEATMSNIEPVTGSRRGTLAALVAGSALGFAAIGGASPVQAARGKKGKKNKSKNSGPNLGNSLPSVRYVYKTTTFDNGGVVSASATCPSGYLPIGAGIWSSIPEPVILTSTPKLESNSWLFELDGAQPQLQATVTAICLAADDDTTLEDTEHRTAHRNKDKRKRKS